MGMSNNAFYDLNKGQGFDTKPGNINDWKIYTCCYVQGFQIEFQVNRSLVLKLTELTLILS